MKAGATQGEQLFKLVSNYKPTGDQPEAIDALVKGLERGERRLVLQGVTGSGKTFTMANLIQRWNRPTLILSHNKTLAAQLFAELRGFFPENAVEYFISYYDYYQPEAYIPQTDTYIEKDASVNEEIERYRLAATNALIARRDVVVVASVSCIYGIGSPILEEVLFRGLLFGLLRRVLPDRISVLITSALFALWHGNILQMLYAFPMGLLFQYLLRRDRLLASPVCCHCGANLTAIVVRAVIT